MPTVIDEATGEERQVDYATYKVMRQGLSESGTRDRLITASRDGNQPVQLWDTLDESWTRRLPQSSIHIYLRKQVWKCNLCDYTTIWRVGDTGMLTHADQARGQAQKHQDASLSTPEMGNRNVAMQVCSACGLVFQVESATQHLERIRRMGALHQFEVEALLVNRFALSPSEPMVYQRELIAVGLKASSVEPDAPLRKNRRRKRRQRGPRGD
jgi:rubredoxin